MLKVLDINEPLVFESNRPWWEIVEESANAVKFRCRTRCGITAEFWLKLGSSGIDEITNCDPFGENMFTIERKD